MKKKRNLIPGEWRPMRKENSWFVCTTQHDSNYSAQSEWLIFLFQSTDYYLVDLPRSISPKMDRMWKTRVCGQENRHLPRTWAENGWENRGLD